MIRMPWTEQGARLELFPVCSKESSDRFNGENKSTNSGSRFSFDSVGLDLEFELADRLGFEGAFLAKAHSKSSSDLKKRVNAGAARLRIGPFALPREVTWAHAGGWQCWSDSPILGQEAIMMGEPDPSRRVFGDSFFYPYEEKPGCFHSWFTSWCGSDTNPGSLAFFGSLSDRFALAFVFDLPSKCFFVDLDVEGWSKGDLEVSWLMPFELRGDRELGQEMRTRVKLARFLSDEESSRPQRSRLGSLPLRGYTSWYHHYQTINFNLIEKNANALPTEMRVFQVDDGYQRAIGDWTSLSDSFGDMKAFEKLIAGLVQRGVTPGLWLAPFVAVGDSKLTKEHGDWLLRDGHGELVRAGHISHWGGDFFALDTERDDVRNWIREVISFWTSKGIGFFKCDFLYAPGIAVGRSQAGESLTRLERARRAHVFLYECIKEQGAGLLSCGAIMDQATGACDFSRIGADVGRSWDDPNHSLRWSREKVSTRSAITNAITRFPWSGAGLFCDGDVSIVRSYDTDLNRAQRELLADVNGLASDLQFVSCDLFAWDDGAYKLYDRLCSSPIGGRPDCLQIEVPPGGWGQDGVAQCYLVKVRLASGQIESRIFQLNGHQL